jgi:hypothetical protein
MPDTPADIYRTLLKLRQTVPEVHGFVENVGGYRPGNSATAAVKFSRHVGHLEMALLVAGIPVIKVTPSKWMKTVLSQVPKERKKRKNAIKAAMQVRYPYLTVTLATADALGLLTYAIGQWCPPHDPNATPSG